MGKLIFCGSLDFQGEWKTGKLETFIGTVQKVTVKINGEGKKEVFVKNIYKTTLPGTKAYYPKNHRSIIRDFKTDLKEGDILEGEILKTTIRGYFVVKLKLDGTNMRTIFMHDLYF